jgi:hypothetical protein
MSPKDAILLLDKATQPSAINQLQRIHFVQIEQALTVLTAFVAEQQVTVAAATPSTTARRKSE